MMCFESEIDSGGGTQGADQLADGASASMATPLYTAPATSQKYSDGVQHHTAFILPQSKKGRCEFRINVPDVDGGNEVTSFVFPEGYLCPRRIL